MLWDFLRLPSSARPICQSYAMTSMGCVNQPLCAFLHIGPCRATLCATGNNYHDQMCCTRINNIRYIRVIKFLVFPKRYFYIMLSAVTFVCFLCCRFKFIQHSTTFPSTPPLFCYTANSHFSTANKQQQLF